MLVKLVRQLLGGTPQPSRQELLARAISFVDERNFAAAEPLYRRLIALDPQDASAWFEHAVVLKRLGRAMDAARACDMAHQLNPHLPGLGTALFTYFDGLRAADLDNANDLTEDWISHLARANTALDAEDAAAAASHLQRAMQLAPDKPHLTLRAGCLAAGEGRMQEADAAFARAAAHGMPPAPYIRLAPEFLASLDDTTAAAPGQPSAGTESEARLLLYASCDPVYFRRFVWPLLRSLTERAAVPFLFHLHIVNPDAWIAEEVAQLPAGGWMKAFEWTHSTHAFAHTKQAKTWYACSRLVHVPALLARHQLPLMMLDVDVLAIGALTSLMQHAQESDAALLQWSAGRWQVWDHFSASTVLFQPTPGGIRFARMVARYIEHFVDRPEGAWYLDQIALYAARTRLAPQGVRFATIPPTTYSLHDRDGNVPPPGAVFHSITANIESNAGALDQPLFQSFLPETRRAFGWTLPGPDQFFFNTLAQAPEEGGRKRWDLGLMRYCEQHFGNRRRRALDIGAHVGFWSEWLSSRFAQVDAFEPHPIMQRCFAENVRAPNTTLHAIGLGARESRTAIQYERNNSGMSHLRTDVAGEIAVRPLDAFGFADVDFIKIDTEGFEAFVLEGGLATLQSNRPLTLIEEIGANTTRFGVSSTRASEIMLSLGARRIAELSDSNFLYAWPQPT